MKGITHKTNPIIANTFLSSPVTPTIPKINPTKAIISITMPTIIALIASGKVFVDSALNKRGIAIARLRKVTIIPNIKEAIPGPLPICYHP